MCLEVVRLSAHKLDEALVLRLDLAHRIVVVDEIDAFLEALAERPAALELALFVHEARNHGRVCARRAEADICVLANRDVFVSEPGEPAFGLRHVRHEPHGAYDPILHGADDAEVHGVAVSQVVSSQKQTLHVQPSSLFACCIHLMP